MANIQSFRRLEAKRDSGFTRVDQTILNLLLEALEEENVEKAVELFLAARLLKIVCEKGYGKLLSRSFW